MLNPYADALKQNPASLAPQDILDSLVVLNVNYRGFNGLTHSGQIVVRRDVAGDIEIFFKLAQEVSFPIAKVIPISDDQYKWDDRTSCADNNSSGFNYRKVESTGKLSNHALGLAFDINPVQNIYIKYDENRQEVFRFPENAVYNPKSPGTLSADHPLVKLMKSLGWDWGGDWKSASGRTDYQHFEKRL